MTRSAAAACRSLLVATLFPVVAACATNGRLPSSSVAEQHSDGVRYVLEHIDSIPSRDQLSARVSQLTLAYCESIARRCSLPEVVPDRPLPSQRLIEGLPRTSEFKRLARELISSLRSARNLREFRAAAMRIQRQAARTLDSGERELFFDASSIARSSAEAWAPVEQGGRGGSGFDLPPGASTAEIDWEEVWEWDLYGCLVTFGCLGGAIAYSAADILWQLSRD